MRALRWPRRFVWRGVIFLVLLGAVGWAAARFLLTPVLPEFADDTEFFKYGSIGNDGVAGVPYPMWVVLPEICAKHLPPGGEGYASFGFLWEPGADQSLAQPIGFSRAKVGVERMSINCALCHTARARTSDNAEPQLYFGSASNTLNIQAYQRFLSGCAADEAFTGDVLVAAMERKVGLSAIEKLLYRFALIPIVGKRLIAQGEAFAWSEKRPLWGPGRIDPFNPVKFDMLELADDGTIGNSDMMPLWNMDAREDAESPTFHWDGLTTSLRDSVLSSMLGDGMVADEYRPESMARLHAYVRTLRPPPSPHRPDPAAVERGKAVFSTWCSDCHGAEGARTATIIPTAEVGTDIQRGLMWTDAAVEAYTNYREGYPWDFTGFRKVDGYLAHDLAGVWLLGPYLHNGAVPTLRDLLKPPAERPVAFLRGSDVLDGANGGFVSPACDPEDPPVDGFCYDTKLTGNGNGGHVFGTTLPQAEKDDLLAYLLTL